MFDERGPRWEEIKFRYESDALSLFCGQFCGHLTVENVMPSSY